GGWWAIKTLENLTLLCASHFPKHLPIELAVIKGLMTFVAVPAEVTTTMGYRVTHSIEALPSTDPDITSAFHHAQLVGLTNEYYSYVTTPEEYPLQHYEGASTLLGYNEGPTLNQEISRLDPKTTSEELHTQKTKFVAGDKKTFGPAYFADLRAGPAQTDSLP